MDTKTVQTVKRVASLVLFMLIFTTLASAQGEKKEVTTTELANLYKKTSFTQTSVHDPSVYWDEASGYYYIYGSHYCGAKSKDLRNWTGIFNYYNTTYDQAFKSNPARKVKRTLNGVTEEVDFPSFDAAAWCSTYHTNHTTNGHTTTADEWVSGDQWAPDLVYNPTMGKWCYYVSLNGDFWASVVVLMTSNSIEGPYTYQGPVVMGGFIGSNNSKDNTNKIAPPSYKGSDLEIVLGTQASLPSKYNKDSSNGSFWPNCIDPCVFYDEEGELWLAYGSWSGGIFMLKLDKETGLRDYTYTYPNVNAGQVTCTSDAYFGKKIAGGDYVSGEGPYIQHIGKYYYLFMSYGGFAPDGGYEMRVFRSTSPTGPYTDANGADAIFSRWVLNYGKDATDNRGMKLIGAMNQWGTMTVGECAQGHNSACTDGQGRSFLVCHTKFNDGTIGHRVRSYQLFTNKFGWLVTAPFQFAGETVTDDSIAARCPFTTADIAGDYHVLLHPYRLDHNNYQEATPKMIHLAEDGSVTGAYIGTWSVDGGTAYFALKLGSVTYNGVITEQTLENNTAKTIAFTTVCNTKGSTSCGVPVWGYKLAPQSAIAYNYQQHSGTHLKVSSSTSKNISIMFDPVENTTLTWSSSHPEVLSTTGKYNPDTVAVPVVLTARLESGDYYWEKAYNTRCTKASAVTGDAYTGLVAYYNFDDKPTKNLYDETQAMTYSRSGQGTVPVLVEDYERFGKVCHQFFGAKGTNSYARIPNPLQGKENLEGFTVSLWVNRADQNSYDALWSFFNSTLPSSAGERLFFTGNSYLGYNNNAGDWFDVNQPETKTVNNLAVGTWSLFTLTFSQENGYKFYLNGTAYTSANMQYAGSAEKKDFNYGLVTQFVSSAKYFFLGMGSFWGSAEAYFDDLMIYDRELTATDVRALNTLLNRVTDFSPKSTLLGDVDGNGVVDFADVTALLQVYLGMTPSYDLAVCDMDGDGSITINDVMALISVCLKE